MKKIILSIILLLTGLQQSFAYDTVTYPYRLITADGKEIKFAVKTDQMKDEAIGIGIINPLAAVFLVLVQMPFTYLNREVDGTLSLQSDEAKLKNQGYNSEEISRLYTDLQILNGKNLPAEDLKALLTNPENNISATSLEILGINKN